MIESVLRMMGRGRAEAEGLDLFTRLLLTSTLERGLAGLGSEALARFARQAFQRLLTKPSGRHVIEFTTTDLAGDGQPPPTVLEILNDDMPFVVESVISELHAEGLIPRLVFHPIYKVQRSASGRLRAVVGPGDGNWEADQESYIAVLLDPIDAARQATLAQALDAVLIDVRKAAADSDAMRARVAGAVSAYESLISAHRAAPSTPAPQDLHEACDLLRWIGQGNFTLLGIRELDLVATPHTFDLRPISAGALGIARAALQDASPEAGRNVETSPATPALTPHMREVYAGPSPLVFSKSAETSRVRRRVPLDCIGVKRYTPNGDLAGETRLFGLFTPAAYMQPVETVPVVRHKVRKVLADARFPAESHNGRTLIDILENFPRDELMQIGQDRLHAWSMTLLDLHVRPRPTLLTRRDDLGSYTSALVFVPRDHYSSAVRERISHYLEGQLGGRVVAFYPYISSSPLVRVQLVIVGGGAPRVPDETLEHGIAEIITTWDERLEQALERSVANGKGSATALAFRGAFSAGYAEMFPVERAVEDIARIERLGPQLPVAIDFYREPGAPESRVRGAIYRFDQPIALSERVPLLENMGFKVIEERSYRIHPSLGGQRRAVVLHDMVLESASGAGVDLASHEIRMEDVFLAVFRGEAESDLFNSLVVAAGLDWREASMMRALAVYMRQMRSPFSTRYIAETLVRYPAIARDILELMRARFAGDPALSAARRDADAAVIRQRIEVALTSVQALDEDRILRRLVNLVGAIVRTNAFVRDPAGQAPPALAFKLASREIDRLPEPKPYREIFVYSPRVEGVHLRFAPIARGGIRWSDRAQDYRTEVLGLAKAQQVKNTVIVPSGAKGGFLPKLIRRDATREEVHAEGVACYRIFIETLLSLTDNLADGAVVPPAGIVRRDGDDPYLVVAADKGTATFSDYANQISLSRGFWLGDAFASGGSAGYDHKRLGITARGAWECVKRHFREMDIDIQTQPFTVVGVGDMSGDVFGNAMLLSPQIRLLAAFDHRDIFIDPHPDPVTSLAERKRLFDLPRSSWADYDRSRISAGGGVFSRNLKAIALTPQMRAALGMDATDMPLELTPADLIQAILRAKVDLLWFGGIGTFVRATDETDEQVGDRANDALRVSAADINARVVGEGANLGVTQRGRIEAAMRGVRLDTDFIDNSAGVNTSDQEVNIKIALSPALASGRLPLDERNRLLAAMSADVAGAVLANNHAQGLALSLAERASRKDVTHLARLTRHLEERGLIDRKLEALPSGTELSARGAGGRGLTRPELAVLMSWSKISLNADLVASKVPDAAGSNGVLSYFPALLRDRFPDDLAAHRLRREIVATRLTNTIVNLGGPDIIMRLAAAAQEQGREQLTVPVLAEAYLAALEIFGVEPAWRRIDALDGRIPGSLQLDLYQGLQELAADGAARLLRQARGRTMSEMVATYRSAAEELAAGLPALLPPVRRTTLEAAAHQLTTSGVPADVALRHAGLAVLGETVALAERADQAGAGVSETMRVLFAAEELLSLGDLRARAAALALTDEFDKQSVATSLAVVASTSQEIATRMLADHEARGVPLDVWTTANVPALTTARSVIEQALTAPATSVARLAVIADALRSIATRTDAKTR